MGVPSENILALEPKSQPTGTAAASSPFKDPSLTPQSNFYTGKPGSIDTTILIDDVYFTAEL